MRQDDAVRKDRVFLFFCIMLISLFALLIFDFMYSEKSNLTSNPRPSCGRTISVKTISMRSL